MKDDILKCMEIFPNSIMDYSKLLGRRCWWRVLHEEGERRRVGVNREVSNFPDMGTAWKPCVSEMERKLFKAGIAGSLLQNVPEYEYD